MRVVFLSRWFPYPSDNGSKLRVFNLLRQLAMAHEVDLVTFDESGRVSEVPEPLQRLCASVQVVPYRPFRPTSAIGLAAALATTPRFLVDTHSPEFAACVRRVLQPNRPDVVIASQLDMAPYALAAYGVPLILEELELSGHFEAFLNARTARRRLRSGLTWWKLSLYLRRVLPKFALCTVVSESEAIRVRRATPRYDRVVVVPNAVEASSYEGDYGPVEPRTLVFNGAVTYAPNLDAARFLVESIFPLVLSEVPAARLRITGRIPTPHMARLSGRPGVELTGYVDNIQSVVARSSVSVVPIRFGGGTRLKILEAMAIGTPVVATRKGAEGLYVQHERDILLADDASRFAECVVRVLIDPLLRARLASSARQVVVDHYDWRVVGVQLRALVDDVATHAMAA